MGNVIKKCISPSEKNEVHRNVVLTELTQSQLEGACMS